MKIIRTAKYQAILKSAKIDDITSEALAEGIRIEMENLASRTIAKERAIENLGKNPDHYKKS